MSRYKELIESISEQNTNGGISFEKWTTLLLTDMAISLAVIADALVERDIPSAEPERKKGKWVLATNFPYGDDCYVCNNCKVKLDSMYPNFCPNCGADMRGEQE